MFYPNSGLKSELEKSVSFIEKSDHSCPLSPDQKAATTTPTPIEENFSKIGPRFDDNESENVLNAIFETKDSHIGECPVVLFKGTYINDVRF